MAQFQACKCSPPCHISTSRIHFRCCHVYRISQVKQKHLLCFSNTALATLCTDFLNFRSSDWAPGLRVHRYVRCNYWKLVPGRPVWYFMHNVSGGYLMHSCSGVQHHIRMRINRHTHVLSAQNLSHVHILAFWQLHKPGNSLGNALPPDKQLDRRRHTHAHVTLPAILQVSR